jgi:hypothetical protein
MASIISIDLKAMPTSTHNGLGVFLSPVLYQNANAIGETLRSRTNERRVSVLRHGENANMTAKLNSSPQWPREKRTNEKQEIV